MPKFTCDICGFELDLPHIVPPVRHMCKSRGLGDTIAKVTHATGVEAIVKKIEKVTGVDCRCRGRQEKLNKLIPYKE